MRGLHAQIGSVLYQAESDDDSVMEIYMVQDVEDRPLPCVLFVSDFCASPPRSTQPLVALQPVKTCDASLFSSEALNLYEFYGCGSSA
jgi:hypothetical protein